MSKNDKVIDTARVKKNENKKKQRKYERAGLSVKAKLVFAFFAAAIFWLILFAIYFYGNITNEAGKELLYDILSALGIALVVGTLTTVLTKIIEGNFISAATNDKTMRAFGVTNIGTGKSTRKDIKELFGKALFKKYPTEVKILFISGNVFFETFREELLNCIKNSECTVKILLLNTMNPENEGYISRMNSLREQDPTYKAQVEEYTLVTLESIYNELDAGDRNRLKVRFYMDEYRYNFRIAKSDDGRGKCWLNVEPFVENAFDLSIRLDGQWSDDSKDGNIFESLDSGFDALWKTYKSTEYKFAKIKKGSK